MESHTADVAVVILTCNQKDVTLRCLESFENVNTDRVGILVWDNGSSDGTKTAIESQFPDVKVHRSEQNLGAAGGRNAGARAAKEHWNPRYLLFLDNDTVVSQGLIHNLRKSFDVDPDIGVTAPKIRLLNDPKRLDSAGGNRVQFHLAQTPIIGHGELDRGQYDEPRECVSAGIIMVRAEVFDALEGFDTGYDPYGFEDVDFSLRVKEAGYSCYYVPDAVVYHSPTQTFQGGEYSPEYARQKAKNWYRFVQRHAGPLEKVGFWLIGVPVRLLGAFVRELKRGNIGAVAGLVSGGFSTIFGSSKEK